MPITTDGIDTNGTESFLKNLLPPDAVEDQPSKEVEDTPEQAEPETEETESDPQEEASEEESEETEEPAKKPTKKYADDEVYVKVKVGDDEYEVPVKDLKRLHGQEASLTRKSQQVAADQRNIEAQRVQYAHKLDTMVQRATQKADQYRQVNFFALSKDPNVTAEMLGALQDEARRAFDEESFLKAEADQFVQGVQKERNDRLVTQARDSIKQINDPDSPHHIPNFSQKLHGEMMQFAIDNGVPAELANNLVDAPSMKILHMAMSFKKGAAKAVTKVVNKSPKKIMKTSTVPTPKSSNVRRQETAMKKLREGTGGHDDVADAFMSRWTEKE